jgi:Ca2+/H+ antiporter, TMEM165/GDT1 family
MVLADGLAIGVGILLHKRLPEKLMHVLASLLFLIFGLWMLFDTALGLPSVAIGVTVAVALATAAVAVAQTLRRRRKEASIAGRSADIV